MKKIKTYFEFWKSKGTYGEIRIKRMLERKNTRCWKRSNAGKGHCNHVKVGWHSCPYQADMNDNDDPHYCRCCRECRNECAGDI